MEWQPIETAPKDFTDILIYDERHGIVYAAFWLKDDDRWVSNACAESYFGCYAESVNYWMPLPTAPTQSQK